VRCSRIFEILPVRIKDWQSSPCVADEKNRTALERIRHQQLLAREKLLALDRRRRDLDVLIERSKHLTVQPEADVSNSYSCKCLLADAVITRMALGRVHTSTRIHRSPLIIIERMLVKTY